MINFFKSKKIERPLNQELREYYEHNLLCLIHDFPEPKIEDRVVLTPTIEHFPIDWEENESDAYQALEYISNNMQIDPNTISLDFYDSAIKEFNMGNLVIFTEPDPENPEALGLYHLEKENGKYCISLNRELLKKPENLIATLAHELSHVKLLGEKELEFNDEKLTDFTTVFFGLGIFSANSAFKFTNEFDRWGYETAGYLTIEEWAYALALFAFIRHEDSPDWKQFLNITIRRDFEKSLNYMIDNENDIFNFEKEGE